MDTWTTYSHDPLCEQARGRLQCGCVSRGWKVIEMYEFCKGCNHDRRSHHKVGGCCFKIPPMWVT